MTSTSNQRTAALVTITFLGIKRGFVPTDLVLMRGLNGVPKVAFFEGEVRKQYELSTDYTLEEYEAAGPWEVDVTLEHIEAHREWLPIAERVADLADLNEMTRLHAIWYAPIRALIS